MKLKITYTSVVVFVLYIISLIFVALDPFIHDLHGDYVELHDGYVFANNRIDKHNKSNGTYDEKIPFCVENYCETPDYILACVDTNDYWILNKKTEVPEGPMTRDAFDRKCRSYNVDFIEETGYCGTSTYPLLSTFEMVFLASAIILVFVGLYFRGEKIEQIANDNIYTFALSFVAFFNISITVLESYLGMFYSALFILVLAFIVDYFLYLLIKRHFAKLGKFILVLFAEGVIDILVMLMIVILPVAFVLAFG